MSVTVIFFFSLRFFSVNFSFFSNSIHFFSKHYFLLYILFVHYLCITKWKLRMRKWKTLCYHCYNRWKKEGKNTGHSYVFCLGHKFINETHALHIHTTVCLQWTLSWCLWCLWCWMPNVLTLFLQSTLLQKQIICYITKWLNSRKKKQIEMMLRFINLLHYDVEKAFETHHTWVNAFEESPE